MDGKFFIPEPPMPPPPGEIAQLVDHIFKGAGTPSKVIFTPDGILVWNNGNGRYEAHEPPQEP
jgi:hypothetical protein